MKNFHTNYKVLIIYKKLIAYWFQNRKKNKKGRVRNPEANIGWRVFRLRNRARSLKLCEEWRVQKSEVFYLEISIAHFTQN